MRRRPRAIFDRYRHKEKRNMFFWHNGLSELQNSFCSATTNSWTFGSKYESFHQRFGDHSYWDERFSSVIFVDENRFIGV